MKRLFCIILLFSVMLQAQIPQTLSYQGVLTDNSGVNVADGNYDLTFKLYAVETGGSALWTETQSVSISDGIFNVILGKVYSINLPFDNPYWLGITVGTGTELTPRIELTSAAYSLKALSVMDNSVTGASVQNNQIVRSVNNIKDNVTISAGDNVSITTAGSSITISAETSGSGGNTLDQAYDQGGAGAGRTITADAGAFKVGGTDGALFTGTYGSGTIPAQGAGIRMMWYPKKAAFRAGGVSGTQWDNSNIGYYSFATGYNTTASGNYSTAMGRSTTASGVYSTAMGYSTTANGYASIAMGNNTTASGDQSIAMGYFTKANGSTSTAMGRSTTASGGNSTAMGNNTTASGYASIAMGNNTTASGSQSIAMGYFNTAYSYALLAFGRYNANPTGNPDTWVASDFILTIGDGTSTSHSNSLTFSKNGYMWIQGTLTQNSDQRLKTDIQPLSNALQKVQSLNGVNHKWKDTETMGNEKQIGLIAQDVEKVFPELVGENEGYKTTNYIGLIPVLVEAIKEQQKLIEKLGQRISELENQ